MSTPDPKLVAELTRRGKLIEPMTEAIEQHLIHSGRYQDATPAYVRERSGVIAHAAFAALEAQGVWIVTRPEPPKEETQL
jgi:hypothetical protein